MTSKMKQAPPPKGYQSSVLAVETKKGGDREEFAQAVARKLTRPEVTAASVIEQWQQDTHDVNALVSELARQVQSVNDGDLKRAEGMLISQAHALDNIFANLARRATNQTMLPHWEAYMRMAMRAQDQCRRTLETLAAVGNPPIFAQQANIAHGPQQVNNGTPTPTDRASVADAPIPKSELLESSDGQRLDTRTASATGSADSHLVPLGSIHRAEDRRG